MKRISDMTRLELAAFIGGEFRSRKINIVLSGGSCVSIYSEEKYVSMDLDFVNAGFAKRAAIKTVMEALGFHEENRYFRHPGSDLLVEFPPGPLGIGDEPVTQINEIETPTGILRIISPTDCVKDRLAWFYHDNDTECLEQAVLVADANDIDITEIERWSKAEGKIEKFREFTKRLARP
ncbi:MAG: hypothetical protein ACI9X0_002581 [Kiritimatiellia bacterium]|jgi:hypothetical protein